MIDEIHASPLHAGPAGTVRIDVRPPDDSGERGGAAATAGFAGRLPPGSPPTPWRIESAAAFAAGGGGEATTVDSHLEPAVRAFFANGGRRAWLAPADAAGLESLGRIPEIRILAAPDLVASVPAMEAADRVRLLLEAPGDALRIVDPPRGLDADEVVRWIARLRPARPGRIAVYHPWLELARPDGGAPIGVPPSGAVAGTFARAVTQTGIPGAPANLPLREACGTERPLDAGGAARLRRAGVNPILDIGRSGPRALGERTLDGGSITVRRVLAHIRAELERRVAWAVFEPPGPGLARAIVRAVTSELCRLWEAGALTGRSADEAFTVGWRRSPGDLRDGRLGCIVGVAPARPAEFVMIHLDRNEGRPPLTEGQEENLARW